MEPPPGYDVDTGTLWDWAVHSAYLAGRIIGGRIGHVAPRTLLYLASSFVRGLLLKEPPDPRAPTPENPEVGALFFL